MRWLVLLSTFLVVALLALLALGQTIPITPAIRHISLDVAALDPNGVLVPNPTQADFQVFDNGVSQTITAFAAPDAGSNILLLFDNSNAWLRDQKAVTGPPQNLWGRMQAALGDFVKSLRPQDQIAVAVFGDRPQLVLPWTKLQGASTGVTLKVISTREYPGKDLYGSAEWATKQFAGLTGRKIVVVFTDGRDARLAPRWFQNSNGQEVLDPLAGLPDNGEAADFQRTLAVVRAADIPLYFVSPLPDQDAVFIGPTGWDYRLNGLSGNATLSSKYLALLRSRIEGLAEASGSRVFYFDRPEAAASTFARVPKALGLGLTYFIEYTPTGNTGSDPHRIEVRIRNGAYRTAQSRTEYRDR